VNSKVIAIRHINAIAFCLLAAALAVLFIHLTTTSDEFGRYNPDWNGTSTFFDSFDRHDITEIADPELLKTYTNSTLLVVAPDTKFSDADLTAYRNFVLHGNTLILADDFGSGNMLLNGLGSSLTILPGDLESVYRAYNDPAMIVAYPVGPTILSPENKSLVLDRAAAIRGGDPVLSTSLLSWVNVNSTAGSTHERTFTQYTVAAHESILKGDIYVISDPSIFINGMQSTDKPYATAEYIETLAGDDRRILIDTYSSRAYHVTGIRGIFQEIQTRTDYKVIIAAALLGIIGLAWRRRQT